MISIGQTYELEVKRAVAFGYYLDAENLGEILLPIKYFLCVKKNQEEHLHSQI